MRVDREKNVELLQLQAIEMTPFEQMGLAANPAHQPRRQTKPVVPDAAGGAAGWTR